MRGKHLRRRFSLQPSFMKDDAAEEDKDKHKRDKVGRHNAVDDAVAPTNTRHKIVVMGAAKVGKTSIITQFLYNTFNTKYRKTVEEMYQANFSISGLNLTLDILDTAGSFEFPAMRTLSISSADAFILVYDITDEESWKEVQDIRELIHDTKGITTNNPIPIVVVGNKKDLVEEGIKNRAIEYTTSETTVTIDWENGFVETSAAKNDNVTQVFKELLAQCKITYNLSPAMRRRRQSLPQQVGASGPNTPGHHHHRNQHQQPQHGAASSSGEQAHSSHAPTAAQLQHLQRIQERSLGGKRNSCAIS